MKIRGFESKSFSQKCRLKLWQKGSLSLWQKSLVTIGFITFFSLLSITVHAEEISAKNDYIQDCKYATCVAMAGSEWSEKHPYGVAIAVSMGTKPAVTDDQIKQVLTRDLNSHGVFNIKFFFENHKAPASVMTLHVDGGTEGPFNISNVRQEIKSVAFRAKMKDEGYLFLPD